MMKKLITNPSFSYITTGDASCLIVGRDSCQGLPWIDEWRALSQYQIMNTT